MIALFAAEEPNVLPTLYNLVDWLVQRHNLSASSAAYALVMIGGILACIIIPYLLGSINPAILISRFVYHEDIRSFGSGNAGSTNMLRTYGKTAAIFTFLFDLAKATVACLVGRWIWEMNGLALAGFFVIVGHMFPIFEKFRGGKGVACLTVVVLITSIYTNNFLLPGLPVTFLILLAVFAIVLLGTRYVSMASVTCAFLYPIFLSNFSSASAGLCVAMAVLSACLVIFKHKDNLKRIYNRTESQISFTKTSKKKLNEQNEQDAGKGDRT